MRRENGSSVIVKQFFDGGQISSATSYFYALDYLGSIRQLTDSSGSIKADYSYDCFGRLTAISEIVASDFKYCGYLWHPRSAMNLTKLRAYNASFGKWINRDPVFENLDEYAYVANNPISRNDPEGAFAVVLILGGLSYGEGLVLAGLGGLATGGIIYSTGKVIEGRFPKGGGGSNTSDKTGNKIFDLCPLLARQYASYMWAKCMAMKRGFGKCSDEYKRDYEYCLYKCHHGQVCTVCTDVDPSAFD